MAEAMSSGDANRPTLYEEGPWFYKRNGLYYMVFSAKCCSEFIAYSTAGAFLWSILLVYAGTVLGARWEDIRHALQPFDLLIALGVVVLIVVFVWWRLGMPGRRRGAG